MKDMKSRFLIVLIGLLFNASLMAQGGGVLIGQKSGGSSAPEPSALLELFSTEKGLLIPRTTIASIVDEPAVGLLIFDTDSSQFLYFDGAEWMSLVNKLEMTSESAELKVLFNSKIDSVTDLFLDMDKIQALQLDTVKTIIAQTIDVQQLINDSLVLEIALNKAYQLAVNDSISSVIADSALAQKVINDSIVVYINSNMSNDTLQSLEIDTLKMILSQIDGDGLSSDTSVLKVNVSTGIEIANDTLRIATGDSAQVMVTTGDGNNVEWVNREEIGKPLEAGSNMVVEDVDGKNIVSLQDTVAVRMLVLDTDSIASVAQAKDWDVVATNDTTSVSTVSYTHKALKEGGDEIDFVYGEKKITRAGLTGLTGTALNADNLEEFLKKVFFPVSTPYINLLSYETIESSQSVDAVTKQVASSVGSVTLPYSIWKDATDLTFNFEVVNQSLTDDSEDTPVSLIEMTKGGSGIETYTIPSGDELKDTIKGSITVDIANLETSATGNSTTTLALKIEDSYPNVQSLDMNFVTSKAIQSSVTSVNAGSDVVFDGSDHSFDLNFVINKGDETLTSVKVDAVDVALDATISSVNLLAANNSQTYEVAVTGDVYNQEVSKTSNIKYWSFECPYGYILLNGETITNKANALAADVPTLKAAIENGAGNKTLSFRSASANYFTEGISAELNGYEVNVQAPASNEKVFVVFLIPNRNLVDISDWKLGVYNPLSGLYIDKAFDVVEVPNFIGSLSYFMIYATEEKNGAIEAEYYKLIKE